MRPVSLGVTDFHLVTKLLTEMNTTLLLDTEQLTETGLRRTADGGLKASWALSWPEQRASGVQPIDEDAAAQLSILRAIASSDLHNLIFGRAALARFPCDMDSLKLFDGTR